MSYFSDPAKYMKREERASNDGREALGEALSGGDDAKISDLGFWSDVDAVLMRLWAAGYKIVLRGESDDTADL